MIIIFTFSQAKSSKTIISREGCYRTTAKSKKEDFFHYFYANYSMSCPILFLDLHLKMTRITIMTK